MLYGIDENAAFNLLKWLSQESNVKLRLVAEQVAEDFCAVSERAIPSRSVFDRLLLSAPGRVSGAPDDSADASA